MKKIINDVNNIILEELQGMQKAYSNILKINYDPIYVTRVNKNSKVSLISGGGSGHEPLHAGFVGYGMLDAACPGEIFTSPTPDQMEEAAKSINNDKGIIFLVKNYTGDVMNFQMAEDLCKAEGIDVRSIIIDDDVSVKDSLYTTGRRGVGATVFFEKICGASAEIGDDINKVLEYANYCKENARSMGMALTSCTVPAVGKPTFDISDNEIEMGIGIHGEPGRERINIKTSSEIAEMMMEAICSDIPYKNGDELICMVNGMGATPLMELYILYNDVVKITEKKGIKIVRNLIGNYVTSIDMAGASISLMKVNDDILKLWDYPVYTAALRWGI
ncbi:dihydroxyacetone kinase subunit DhaK [Brachyspira hyodysenteriae]|uniref:dihydroxyacetone kinase subunit DhaK n=1 Tax=Brachyspira hyodysenteriae TaxID=159 RepID=UPI0011831B2B|nr:dihydroxyacetone kinase subunit DhaK [Brachyspira hyodysenteriae]TVL57518.1 dihydroxyacetone kinase subunit DhaK [Brachyspira hyodysenteriae]